MIIKIIVNSMIKKKIEIIWVNKIINLLNRLFQDNLEWQTRTAINYTQFLLRSLVLCWWFLIMDDIPIIVQLFGILLTWQFSFFLFT